MVNYRNERLVEKILLALKTKNRVIVPWGAAHKDGIQKLLEQHGFYTTQKSDIFYGSLSDEELPEFVKLYIQAFLEEGLQERSECLQ